MWTLADGRALFAGYCAIDGNSARTFDQHDDCERYRQEMEFKSLAFLLAGPVHEEAIYVVDGCDGDQHVDDDAQRCDTAEQTNQKSETTEEFGANCQERQRRRNSHLLGEEPHGAVEARTSKPAQHFLRAVHKERDAKHQAHDGKYKVIRSRKEFAKHGILLKAEGGQPIQSIE